MGRLDASTNHDLGKLFFPKGCNNCGEKVTFTENSFGREIYLCTGCGAYVGCHKPKHMNKQPLGRLSGKDERWAKKELHSLFDPLWQEGIINILDPNYYPDTSNRKKAYKWLSKKMNINFDQCHIGMFDIDQAKKASNIIREELKKVV